MSGLRAITIVLIMVGGIIRSSPFCHKLATEDVTSQHGRKSGSVRIKRVKLQNNAVEKAYE